MDKKCEINGVYNNNAKYNGANCDAEWKLHNNNRKGNDSNGNNKVPRTGTKNLTKVYKLRNRATDGQNELIHHQYTTT